MKQNHNDWAVIVLVVSADNKRTVLVREPWTDTSWKIPGGKKEAGETPEETGRRELREETGLVATRMVWLATEERRGHDFILYAAYVESFSDLIPEGDEGEETGIFPVEAIRDGSIDFYDKQKNILHQAGLL